MNAHETLIDAWHEVLNIFEPDNSWKEPTKCTNIQQRLLHLSPKHRDDPDSIDRTVKALMRGVPLLEAAVGWQNPAIAGDKRTPTDKLRGIQWRLVIAYSGFEITTKALLSCSSPDFETLIDKCSLPAYESLGSPNKQWNLEKWLQKEEGAIVNFLGIIAKGDREIIEHWLVNSRSIDSWKGAVELAKALRNVTAHGFLVPTKVKQWGLKPAVCKLTDDLALIIAGALRKLT